jgi:secreted Zn-dependent insulinase-like peptidase
VGGETLLTFWDNYYHLKGLQGQLKTVQPINQLRTMISSFYFLISTTKKTQVLSSDRTAPPCLSNNKRRTSSPPVRPVLVYWFPLYRWRVREELTYFCEQAGME